MISLGDLAAVQEVDLRLDILKARRRDLEAQVGEAPGRPALQAEIEVQDRLLREARAHRKTLEAQAEAAQTKIAAEEQKLYGGVTRDARELQGLQQEIYVLRRTLKEQEDIQLAAVEAEESEHGTAQYLAGLRDRSDAAWAERQTSLSDDQQSLAEEITALEAAMAECRADSSGSDLAIYDQHRLHRRVVLAAVSAGICGSCRLALPTVLLTRARRETDVVECPACRCIIWAP